LDAAGRRELIEELCSFKGRWPGTDAERRAANRLAERLRERGRKVTVEPTYVHPEYSLVIAAHALLALGGSLLALAVAPVGFALVLVAAASLYLDLNTRFYLIRRLFFRRASQNVVSPGSKPSAPARLILSAHYDASKTGLAFGPRTVRLLRRLPERTRILLGPVRILFWGAIVPLLAISGARLAGVDAQWLGLVQLFPSVLLLVAIVLLVDIALSEVVPGACDNGSGVAAVFSLSEALDDEPPANLDVWVLLPGAEECMCEGMRSFLRAHRSELDGERTFLVNVDTVAFGDPRYEISEGLILSQPMDRRLVELSEAIATADREGDGRLGVAGIRHSLQSDALPAQVAGLRTIGIAAAEDGVILPAYYHTHEDTPDKLDEGAMTRAVEFTLELVRQIDREVGRRDGR
jgi:peptidase M28-like protein